MPVRAQLLGTALSSALIASNYTKGLTDLFGFVILLATSSTLVLYLVVALSALRLMARGELVKGWLLLVAAVGAAYAAWTLYGAGGEALAWGAVLLATAVPVYFLMRSRAGSSQQAAAIPAAPRESSS
jgi:APA family basic amino acid/polyamine antiporter